MIVTHTKSGKISKKKENPSFVVATKNPYLSFQEIDMKKYPFEGGGKKKAWEKNCPPPPPPPPRHHDTVGKFLPPSPAPHIF